MIEPMWYSASMIARVVKKLTLQEAGRAGADLAFWMVGPPRSASRRWSSSGDNSMETPSDFRELLASLNAHSVDYLIVE